MAPKLTLNQKLTYFIYPKTEETFRKCLSIFYDSEKVESFSIVKCFLSIGIQKMRMNGRSIENFLDCLLLDMVHVFKLNWKVSRKKYDIFCAPCKIQFQILRLLC